MYGNLYRYMCVIVCMYVCIYVSIYVCMYVCMYEYIMYSWMYLLELGKSKMSYNNSCSENILMVYTISILELRSICNFT